MIFLPIRVNQHGSLLRTKTFLKKSKNYKFEPILRHYGEIGVAALSSATPVDTGKTASSWGYKIENNNGQYRLTWYNDNVNDGNMIALLLQYGHGTRNGGYVQGIDYINPALRPIFERMTTEIWNEVKR